MKNTLILIFTFSLTIYFSGCGEDTVNVPPVTQTTTVSGKIENWRLGSNKKMYLVVFTTDTSIAPFALDTCVIDSQGNFTMNLSTPADSLMVIYKLDTVCTAHTVINPPGLRFCFSEFIVADSTGIYIGYVRRSNDTVSGIHTGKIWTDLNYFNAGGSITGSDTCNFGSTYILISSVTQSKGWNTISYIYEMIPYDVVKITFTTQPQTVRWYYFPYYDKNGKLGGFYRQD